MKKILIVLVILGLLSLGFYFINKDKNTEVIPPVVVKDTDIKGCYVAKLAQDVYVLKIASQDKTVVRGMLAYDNYQKDSSSGDFSGTFADGILLGNYSFDSEGMHSNRQVIFKKVGDNFAQGFGPVSTVGDKEIFTNTTDVTYDPKSTFVKSVNCTEHFTGGEGSISFDYNSFFVARAGDKTPTMDWKLDGKQKGMILAAVSVSQGYMPSTNFINAKLTVGRSADAKAIKSCIIADTSMNEVVKGTVTVGGYPFTKIISSDVGAGNFYEMTSYRGIVDGDCYVVEYTIHSANIGNYSPDQGIKEFDKAIIVKDMENIVKSLKFLVSSN